MNSITKNPGVKIYDEIYTTICEKENSLTAEDAKTLLGWCSPKEGEKYGPGDIHLRDRSGTPVHCTNITQYQRRYYMGSCKDLMFEILSGHWEMNGDTITIGSQGWVLDGKHRLTSLVLASQEWERNPERYPFWTSAPTIDVIIVFGIPESAKVVNTIGTGKSRTIADSIFASGLFNTEHRKDMGKLSKLLEHAVRLLWDRTGAREDAYNPRISHSEALDFVERHPTLLTCVRTVFQEDGDESRLAKYFPLGYLSGLMYMMATEGSDTKEYRESTDRLETMLGEELPSYELADKFIAALGSKDKALSGLFTCIEKWTEEGVNRQDMKLAAIAKAWNLFKEDKPVTKLTVKLVEKEGVSVLVDQGVGGIDNGV